ncbi:PAS domain-containing protein [Belliella baltica DSM 15883]|uniref:histidine kinase n=2 Tax=Belliella TaxID=232244 RepID=I3Z0P2_BELBD|nr:PAS domain-containing protein [Belliella baltica DSM 15883]
MIGYNKSSILTSNYFYFISLDSGNRVLETNSKFHSQLSIFENSLIGQVFGEILFPNDFLNYQRLLSKTLEKGERNFKMDLRKINEDGSDFHWTRWEFSIDRGIDQEFTINGIGHDILKNNEKTIEFPDFIYEHQIKNEIMEGLFEDNLIGFWIWDIENDTDILSVSLRTMLGYDYEIKRKNEVKWKKHIHQQDFQKVLLQLNDHFSSFGKIPFHSEMRVRTLTGKEIWTICYGKVIKWSNEGKASSMVGCFFDVSEKKKSEGILEKQNQFLKTLTFNQSHLMRSKLANIMGILEVIQPKQNPEEVPELIALIKEEAFKLDIALQESIHSSSAFNSDKSD